MQLGIILIGIARFTKKRNRHFLTQTNVTYPGESAWVNFCWVRAAGLSEPLPHYSLLQTPSQSHLGKYVIFCDPNLVTFHLCVYLALKNEPLLITYSADILVCLLTVKKPPKNRKCAAPFLVTLLKLRCHDSQSSHENATQYSGTIPLASYKEV